MIVQLIHLELAVVLDLTKLPEWPVMQLIVQKETSGLREAIAALQGVWRSATLDHGAQCVMISGELSMLELLAESWGYLFRVCNESCSE